MNPWAPDSEFIPHEKPSIAETVGTSMEAVDGQVVVGRYQDVEPILDHCKELVNSNTYRTPSGDMHHAAEFPLVLVEKYLADKGVTFRDFLTNAEHAKHMLADPALRDFCIARNVVHKVYR